MSNSVLKSPACRLPFRRILLRSVFALFVAYLAFCTVFYLSQERYLLEPNADPTGGRPSALKEAEFVLPVRGQEKVHYRRYFTTASPAKGTVFYLHGNKGNMDKCEWEIEFMIELGYDVWTMDYRGYGASIGPVSELALKEDAKAVFDKLQESDASNPVIIWGRSFGSGVAASVVAAAHKKPRMLVLETPYWSLVDAVRQKHPYLPPIVFRYELPVHKFLQSADCPIHLIHGTQDEKIPSNSSDRLLNLCRNQGINAIGYSVMCGKHNLRGLAEFQRIAAMILTTNRQE